MFYLLRLLWFPLLMIYVNAHSTYPLFSARQQVASELNCTAVCDQYHALSEACTPSAPHCACTVDFLQAQGLCNFCNASTPASQAAVQLLLDDESSQCHQEGAQIFFGLNLPAAAANIVESLYHQSAVLRTQQTGFLVLQIMGGQFGLVILLIGHLAWRRHNSNPTFIGFCVAWILSSISFSLSLYRGPQGGTILKPLGEVSRPLCLTQATLTEGSRILTAVVTLSLVAKLWLCLYLEFRETKPVRRSTNIWINTLLVTVPYIFLVVFGTLSFMFSEQRESIPGTTTSTFLPNNFYCALSESHPLFGAIGYLMILCQLVTLGFYMQIMRIMWQNWLRIRGARPNGAVSTLIFLQVTIFSIYHFIVVVSVWVASKIPQAGIVDTTTVGLPVWADLFEATSPLMATVIFSLDVVMMKLWPNQFKNRMNASGVKDSDSQDANADPEHDDDDNDEQKSGTIVHPLDV